MSRSFAHLLVKTRAVSSHELVLRGLAFGLATLPMNKRTPVACTHLRTGLDPAVPGF